MPGGPGGYAGSMDDSPRVTDIMTTDVIALRPEMPLEEAAWFLAERGVSGAPVVDDQGQLVGLLDDSDLLTSRARLHAPTTIELLGAYIPLPGEKARYEQELRHALGRTVGEVMTDPAPAIRPDDTAEDAATVMVRDGVSRVPVVEDGVVVGVVSRGDLIIALSRDPGTATEGGAAPAGDT